PPRGGSLRSIVVSSVPLVLRPLLRPAAFVVLAPAPARWEVSLAATLVGAGVGFAFASMANLIVEAVPAEQTGVATGMNTIVRTIGGGGGGEGSAGGGPPRHPAGPARARGLPPWLRPPPGAPPRGVSLALCAAG